MEPQLIHLAIDVRKILVGNRNPLRLACSARRGGIHTRLAREEDVGLAVHMAVNVGTQILVVIHFEAVAVSLEELFGSLAFQNLCKVVLFAVNSILRNLQNVAESLSLRLIYISRSLIEFEALNKTYASDGEVYFAPSTNPLSFHLCIFSSAKLETILF